VTNNIDCGLLPDRASWHTECELSLRDVTYPRARVRGDSDITSRSIIQTEYTNGRALIKCHASPKKDDMHACTTSNRIRVIFTKGELEGADKGRLNGKRTPKANSRCSSLKPVKRFFQKRVGKPSLTP
jgi:hypothetical protein